MLFTRQFTAAFHSASLYRSIREGRRMMLGYACILTIITAALVSIFLSIAIQHQLFTAREGRPPLFDDILIQISQQVPVMTFKDDQLATITNEPTTISITLTKGNDSTVTLALATIDTSGNTTEGTMTTPFLLTADAFISNVSGEINILPYAEYKLSSAAPQIINRAVAEDAANRAIEWTHEHLNTIYLVFFLCIALSMLVLRLFMLFFLGLIGISIASVMRIPLPYASAVGMASLSYTPIALLDMAIFLTIGISPKPLTLALAGAVLVYAAIKSTEPQTRVITG